MNQYNNTLLISKFMGFNFVEVGYFNDESESEWQRKNHYWMDENGMEDVGKYFVNVSENKWYKLNEAKYHSSWDWLMPVIKKFQTLEPSGQEFKLQKYKSDWCDKINIIEFNLLNIDLLNTYAHVVKSIEWHNGH